MDFQTAKQLTEQGLGTAAFVALLFFGYKVWKFMDLLVNNHLSHIQASLEDVGKHTERMAEHMESMADAIKELRRS